MRIRETLELSISDDMDVNKLERYLAREIKRFGKQVFGKGQGGSPGESAAIPVHPAGADKV